MGGMLAAYGDPPKPPPDRGLHLDDPRLDLFWKKCAELRIPVSLHIADPPSAWRPPDNHQERLPRFQIFNQYGMGGSSYEELISRRDRLLARHPDTTFILCHLSNQGNDLATLSTALDRFPNLYLDLAARASEIGRQPRNAASSSRNTKTGCSSAATRRPPGKCTGAGGDCWRAATNTFQCRTGGASMDWDFQSPCSKPFTAATPHAC